MLGLIVSLSLGTEAIASEPKRPKADLAIVGAKIYSSPDASPIEDGIVLIRAGRISRVGPRSAISVPDGMRVINAQGSTLLPGFWNNHVHMMTPELLGAENAKAEVLQHALESMLTRWGFTTVFDLASSTDNTLILRDRVESGEVSGPKILTVGDPFYPKDGTPSYVRDYLKAHGAPNEEVSSPEEAATRARRQLARGTDGVKIFAGAVVGGKIGVLPMRLDIAQAVVTEGHRYDKPAFAHPASLAGLNIAIDSGVDVLAHTTAMDGGDKGGWSPELIARMRAHNMAVIPTLTLLEVEGKKVGESPELLAKAIRATTSEVHDYAAAGGEILFGTDVGYTDAFDPTEEYRLMATALGWRQILVSLTTAPAKRFGVAAHKGKIVRDMDADLVLLYSDPAQDPTAFARVRDTIRAGRVIWGADR